MDSDTSAVSLELMLDQADRSDDILTGIHGVAIDVSHTLSGVTELASLQQGLESIPAGRKTRRANLRD